MASTADIRDDLEQLAYECLEDQAHTVAGDLYAFVHAAWHTVEPGRDLVDNWHIKLICSELERVTAGELTKLVICIPPGHMKSLLVSVFWPAWEWLTRPYERSQFLSGSNSVRKRDSRRCREAITSPWYQRILRVLQGEEAWELSQDQNEKINFANTEQGFRQCMTIGGKITGDRADKQALDDPYDVEEVLKGTQERIAERMEEVVETWDVKLSSRLNDKRDGKRVVIMQRVDERDLAGRLLERGWPHVVLQSEYDPDFKYNHPDDPRTKKGELLFPQMFPREVIDEIKNDELGPRHFAAQHQQSPNAPEGDLYLRLWFYTKPKSRVLREDVAYRELPPPSHFDRIIQTWDFSAGSKSSSASYACGHIIGMAWPNFWLWPTEMRGRWSFSEMKAAVRDMSARHPEAELKLVEWKASGPDVCDDLDDEIGGFIPFEPASSGSKDVRWDIASVVPEGGNLRLPHRMLAPWINDWVDEMCALPSEPNDRGDTFAQAIIYLKGRRKTVKAPKKPRRIGKLKNPFS